MALAHFEGLPVVKPPLYKPLSVLPDQEQAVAARFDRVIRARAQVQALVLVLVKPVVQVPVLLALVVVLRYCIQQE